MLIIFNLTESISPYTLDFNTSPYTHTKPHLNTIQQTQTPENPHTPKSQSLISNIITFNVDNGLENETVDFLLEVDQLDLLVGHIDASAIHRVCSYLLACRQYIPTLLPQNEKLIRVVFDLNVRHGFYADALVAALLGQKEDLAEEAFRTAKTAAERLQLAFIVGETGENRVEKMERFVRAAKEAFGEESALLAAMGREGLSDRFVWLAEKFSVAEVKKLEDIFKNHLVDRSTFNKCDFLIFRILWNFNVLCASFCDCNCF